jgi:hypothetical protein
MALIAISGGGSGKNYVINLTNDITIPGSTGATFAPSNIKVSLRGAHTISLYWDGTNGTLLNLGADQTLFLRGSTLAGVAANTLPLVSLNASTSKFYMRSGKISGNTTTYVTGGAGVYIQSGAFTMYGGEISGNATSGGGPGNGGGVYVGNGGTFTMEGGVISGNSTTATGYGGGVYVASGGSFTKTGGGTIYGDTDAIHMPGDIENTAPSAASGRGHAVYDAGSNKYRDITALPGNNINTGDGEGLFLSTAAINDEDFGPSPFTIENTFTVNNTGDWSTALSTISGGGNDKNYVINLTNDFDLGGISSGGSFGISATGIKVSLRGAALNNSLVA